jgi:hypothetical protein
MAKGCLELGRLQARLNKVHQDGYRLAGTQVLGRLQAGGNIGKRTATGWERQLSTRTATGWLEDRYVLGWSA